jgi:hypothetical protein
VEEREITRLMRETRAARFEFSPPEASTADGDPDGDGMHDYSGAFRPDFALEDLSRSALATQCKEFALDLHLLVRAAHLSVEQRWGDAARREIARDHWAGAAPVYVARVREALGIEGDDMDAILKTLQVDPAFPGEYVRAGCERIDDRRGRFWIHDCDALADPEPRGWLTALDDPDSPGPTPVVCAVNPRARCRELDPAELHARGERPARAWEIDIDPGREPRPESPWANVARISTASGFRFRTSEEIRSE